MERKREVVSDVIVNFGVHIDVYIFQMKLETKVALVLSDWIYLNRIFFFFYEIADPCSDSFYILNYFKSFFIYVCIRRDKITFIKFVRWFRSFYYYWLEDKLHNIELI